MDLAIQEFRLEGGQTPREAAYVMASLGQWHDRPPKEAHLFHPDQNGS